VEITPHVGGEKAQLLVIENGTSLFEHRCLGGPESSFYEFFANWKDKDPRFSTAMERPDIVLSDVTDIDRASFERSAIYNDYLIPDGTRYTIFGNFPIGTDLVLAPAFIRADNEGPFEPGDIAKLTALIPHLKRATRLRHLVRSMRDHLEDARLALDVVPSAAALLDQVGKIVCANALAEALFRERAGIGTEHGRLTASPPAARELTEAISRLAQAADAGACRPLSPATAATICIPLGRARGGHSLSVVLFALRPSSELRERGSRRARILALIHDPRRRIRLNPALVAQLHGLTSTEAALATAIAEGHTLAEFAIVRGCTELTARTHLKRILDKTGTNRQPELVRVLLTSVAMHSFQ
jgi:DNA-binding CsgD family transcriptional regulator